MAYRQSRERNGKMKLNWIDLHYNGIIYSKKNSKQIVRVGSKMFLVSNQNAKNCEKSMSTEFCAQVLKHNWKPSGRYAVSMYFTRESNIRRDLDNLATSVLDALVLAGALEDDGVKCVKELHVYDMGVNKDTPGVSVHLEESFA